MGWGGVDEGESGSEEERTYEMKWQYCRSGVTRKNNKETLVIEVKLRDWWKRRSG
jgi:hypothetical protein